MAIGLFVSLALTHFLKNTLIGVTITDTLTHASVTLTACFIPAWRAAEVDPTVALHYE